MPENILSLQRSQDATFYKTKGPTETASQTLDDALKQALPNLPYLLSDSIQDINMIEQTKAPQRLLTSNCRRQIPLH